MANISEKYKDNFYNENNPDDDVVNNFLQPLFNGNGIHIKISEPVQCEDVAPNGLIINDFYYDYSENTLFIGTEVR